MSKNDFYLLIDEIVDLPPGTIQGEESLASLISWDSLAVVAFMVAISKHLGVLVSPHELAAASSVQDLLRLTGLGSVPELAVSSCKTSHTLPDAGSNGRLNETGEEVIVEDCDNGGSAFS